MIVDEWGLVDESVILDIEEMLDEVVGVKGGDG